MIARTALILALVAAAAAGAIGAFKLIGGHAAARTTSTSGDLARGLTARMNAPREVPQAALVVGSAAQVLPLLWSWWRHRYPPNRSDEPKPPQWEKAGVIRREGADLRLVLQTNIRRLRS
jgi:hypothetical protein